MAGSPRAIIENCSAPFATSTTRRERRAEDPAGGDLGCGVRKRVRPGLPHRAQFLGVTLVHAAGDVSLQTGDLPVAENSHRNLYAIPWFKKMRPELIAEHAAAYRKVAENVGQLFGGRTVFQ